LDHDAFLRAKKRAHAFAKGKEKKLGYEDAQVYWDNYFSVVHRYYRQSWKML